MDYGNFNNPNQRPITPPNTGGAGKKAPQSSPSADQQGANVSPKPAFKSGDEILGRMNQLALGQQLDVSRGGIEKALSAMPTHDDVAALDAMFGEEFPHVSEMDRALYISEMLVNQNLGKPEVHIA